MRGVVCPLLQQCRCDLIQSKIFHTYKGVEAVEKKAGRSCDLPAGFDEGFVIVRQGIFDFTLWGWKPGGSGMAHITFQRCAHMRRTFATGNCAVVTTGATADDFIVVDT